MSAAEGAEGRLGIGAPYWPPGLSPERSFDRSDCPVRRGATGVGNFTCEIPQCSEQATRTCPYTPCLAFHRSVEQWTQLGNVGAGNERWEATCPRSGVLASARGLLSGVAAPCSGGPLVESWARDGASGPLPMLSSAPSADPAAAEGRAL